MTSQNLKPSLIILAAGIALAAGVLWSGPTRADMPKSEPLMIPAIPFAKAMEVASATTKGTLIGLELDQFNDRPVYFAEIESETSHTILRIDGTSGAVLATASVTASTRDERHAMLEELDHDDMDDDEVFGSSDRRDDDDFDDDRH